MRTFNDFAAREAVRSYRRRMRWQRYRKIMLSCVWPLAAMGLFVAALLWERM